MLPYKLNLHWARNIPLASLTKRPCATLEYTDLLPWTCQSDVQIISYIVCICGLEACDVQAHILESYLVFFKLDGLNVINDLWPSTPFIGNMIYSFLELVFELIFEQDVNKKKQQQKKNWGVTLIMTFYITMSHMTSSQAVLLATLTLSVEQFIKKRADKNVFCAATPSRTGRKLNERLTQAFPTFLCFDSKNA